MTDNRRRDRVTRPIPITIRCDGVDLETYPGETLAAALLASGRRRFRDDRGELPRGMFCNMGTCSECFVWIKAPGQSEWRRRRACVTPATAGLALRTREDFDDAD